MSLFRPFCIFGFRGPFFRYVCLSLVSYVVFVFVMSFYISLVRYLFILLVFLIDCGLYLFRSFVLSLFSYLFSSLYVYSFVPSFSLSFVRSFVMYLCMSLVLSIVICFVRSFLSSLFISLFMYFVASFVRSFCRYVGFLSASFSPLCVCFVRPLFIYLFI